MIFMGSNPRGIGGTCPPVFEKSDPLPFIFYTVSRRNYLIVESCPPPQYEEQINNRPRWSSIVIPALLSPAEEATNRPIVFFFFFYWWESEKKSPVFWRKVLRLPIILDLIGSLIGSSSNLRLGNLFHRHTHLSPHLNLTVPPSLSRKRVLPLSCLYGQNVSPKDCQSREMS